MFKKLLSTVSILFIMGFVMAGCGSKGNTEDLGASPTVSPTGQTDEITPTETPTLGLATKSVSGNPITGFDSDGNLVYGGDPAALVDGDTVYLYTGHDTATSDSYVIPEWQCYSTKDMIHWSYEGVILKCADISWANDKNSSWAAQTAKHYDAAAGKDKYYLYFCTWDKTSEGKQSIGVAVSDSPTGPFTDIGQPLVKGTTTENQTSNWNDIDPTVWIETDAQGIEHRYLCWGNGKNYICELNEDMISVKDLDEDGEITYGTDIINKAAPSSYTEAPWIYRQQDENGNYFGKYYLFYAFGWREQMAYATTDDLLNGTWKSGGVIMTPTATSNTNHMSVIDFKGETYFIYHNGSLLGGSGFRRVVCVEKLVINEDGTINTVQETSTGLSGNAVYLTDSDGVKIGHEQFDNPTSDSSYPFTNLPVGTQLTTLTEEACLWEIVPGLSDQTNEDYISIEAYNKPGLYLTTGTDNIVLTQAFSTMLKANQTFKVVKGLSGDGISFESLGKAGFYITIQDGNLVLTEGESVKDCTFNIETK